MERPHALTDPFFTIPLLFLEGLQGIWLGRMWPWVMDLLSDRPFCDKNALATLSQQHGNFHLPLDCAAPRWLVYAAYFMAAQALTWFVVWVASRGPGLYMVKPNDLAWTDELEEQYH
jgi:hypothetical protein